MKVYIAAPLFNELEIDRNEAINKLLLNEGFETYLPQEHGGIFYELRKKGQKENEIRKRIFAADLNAISSCDTILCMLDGRVLDEGMCIELGIAFALKKNCIGYKTDCRCQDMFGNNIMLDGVLTKVFNNKIDLMNHLHQIEIQELFIELN